MQLWMGTRIRDWPRQARMGMATRSAVLDGGATVLFADPGWRLRGGCLSHSTRGGGWVSMVAAVALGRTLMCHSIGEWVNHSGRWDVL